MRKGEAARGGGVAGCVIYGAQCKVKVWTWLSVRKLVSLLMALLSQPTEDGSSQETLAFMLRCDQDLDQAWPRGLLSRCLLNLLQ
jgi:hypothetical protein